jgi:hypothetical protein
MHFIHIGSMLTAAWLLAASNAAAADEAITRSLAALTAVDREGKNNEAAGLAWKSLVNQGAAALFPTLEAIDDAKPTASNWLRTAAGAIAETEVKAKRPLPADKLEAFAKDIKRAATARVLAYELLTAQDKTAADRLLPGFLDDPSSDLRRAAVAAEYAKLEKSARPSIKADLEKLLTFARDKEQVEAIAKKLDKDYQTKINLAEHFAFITHWDIIGPFDSVSGKALTLKHPPEEKVSLDAKLKGKEDAEVKWKAVVTRDAYGVVDLNKEIGKNHNAAGYAAAILFADKSVPIEVRIGSPNALQVFLNGQKLFEREEYHHGVNMDYHIGKGSLNAGSNTLLIKVCQNNQKDVWAQSWQFQARICDATGAPVPGVSQMVGEKKTKIGSVPETK